MPRLSVVFCDNYFTSFDLVQNLHANLGVKCIGTVRPNRMGGTTLKTDKKLMKEGRGAFDYRSAEGLIAVKWFDNKWVKSRRWYFSLFGYILDLCISNAWLVYKRDCGQLNKKP